MTHARLLALVLVLAAVVAAAVSYDVLSASAPSASERAANAGLRAARQQMVWSSGPRLSQERVVPLGRLDATLRALAPASVRANINVPSLLEQYGKGRRVAVLLLDGTYNSLPPDEGVNVSGSVVVLVDMQHDRVLMVMD